MNEDEVAKQVKDMAGARGQLRWHAIACHALGENLAEYDTADHDQLLRERRSKEWAIAQCESVSSIFLLREELAEASKPALHSFVCRAVELCVAQMRLRFPVAEQISAFEGWAGEDRASIESDALKSHTDIDSWDLSLARALRKYARAGSIDTERRDRVQAARDVAATFCGLVGGETPYVVNTLTQDFEGAAARLLTLLRSAVQ